VIDNLDFTGVFSMPRVGWEKVLYIISLCPVFILTGSVMYLISSYLIPDITKLSVTFRVLIGLSETVLLTVLFIYILKKRIEKQG